MPKSTTSADGPKKDKKRRRYKSYAWTDPKTGYLYARVRVPKPEGGTKAIYKRAMNLTHAEQLGDEIVAEYEDRGSAFVEGYQKTFAALAEWYKENIAVPAVYKDGVKIDGMRTWASERSKIDRISSHLGKKILAEIDEDVLRAYRLKRLKTISFATANRELETVRAMLTKAKRKKWLKYVPDFDGLIEKSLEKRRTVTISGEHEETAILAAARNHYKDNPRLYALIIALRDSGARPSELYPVNDHSEGKTAFEPLRWRDVFADDGSVLDISRLVSYKGKIKEVRLCVITDRLKEALVELWNYLKQSRAKDQYAADLDNMIFPHTTYKKIWDIVRVEAGVPDLRLRDLRRDWVTRLGKLGMSDKLAQRAAGHKTVQMSFHYTEFDLEAAMQTKAMLDADNARDSPDAVN